MNARSIGYWITTALVAVGMLAGGAMDISRSPQVLEGLAHLGYPAYFALIIGVWKVGGGLALLAPRLPLLKEWAYAGIMFDLTGAALSHAASGDPAANVATPLVLAAVTVGSWWLRPASRRLVPAPGGAASASGRVPAAA